MLTRADYIRTARALALGALGGTVFFYFNLPLPWMMGAMVFTTVAAISGESLYVPSRFRSLMVTVLGLLLGATFTPEMIHQAGQWPLTLVSVVIYSALLTGLLYLYFRRTLGYDPVTAYFSATPGGLGEMVIIGRAQGGDDRTIALIHGSRVLLVVMIIPFGFRWLYGAQAGTAGVGPSLMETPIVDVGVLALCAVVGVVLGKLVRLPAYRLIGPMLVSAAVHITGLSSSVPPTEVLAVAQVAIGSSIGARFSGIGLHRVLRTIGASLGSTALMLLATALFAYVLSYLSVIELAPLVLAFAPGGLAEMSLIALALGIETAFVASHHAFRISLIVIAAPLVFKLVRPRPKKPR